MGSSCEPWEIVIGRERRAEVCSGQCHTFQRIEGVVAGSLLGRNTDEDSSLPACSCCLYRSGRFRGSCARVRQETPPQTSPPTVDFRFTEASKMTRPCAGSSFVCWDWVLSQLCSGDTDRIYKIHSSGMQCRQYWRWKMGAFFAVRVMAHGQNALAKWSSIHR